MPKTKILTYAGIGSASILASLPVFLTLGPVIGLSSVHAETTDSPSKTFSASATVNSTLGLSVDSVNLGINPTSTGAVLKTGQATATVSTNNATGYMLYFTDTDSNNSLKHENLPDAKIDSITSAVTGTDMPANTWGYTLGASASEAEDEVDNATNLALNYSPIPTTRAAIKKFETATANNETKITFGVKVDTEIPSGVYSDEVALTVVPNYNSSIVKL